MTYGPAGWRGAALCRGDLVVSSKSGFQRTCVLDPHERAIARSKQKLSVHQRAEERGARFTIESPQAPRLRFGQPQAGHFQELPSNALKHFLAGVCTLRRHTVLPSTDPTGLGLRGQSEQPMCHDFRVSPAADHGSLRMETPDFFEFSRFMAVDPDQLAAQRL